MKAKAIIMKPNRTNAYYIIPKKKLEGKVFTFDKNTYFIDPNCFQVTRGWKWGWKWHYATFYYKEGLATPLPVPDFGMMLDAVKETKLDDGTIVKTAKFKNVVNLGVSASELAAIFTPWFYRTIAQQTKTAYEQLMFYGVLFAAAAAGYVAYMLITGNYAWPLGPIPKPVPTPAVP